MWHILLHQESTCIALLRKEYTFLHIYTLPCKGYTYQSKSPIQNGFLILVPWVLDWWWIFPAPVWTNKSSCCIKRELELQTFPPSLLPACPAMLFPWNVLICTGEWNQCESCPTWARYIFSWPKLTSLNAATCTTHWGYLTILDTLVFWNGTTHGHRCPSYIDLQSLLWHCGFGLSENPKK